MKDTDIEKLKALWLKHLLSDPEFWRICWKNA